MAFVLGITGGIGTGKTTVLRMLESLGAQTLSADDLARDVLAKGAPAYHEVVKRFGSGILAADGKIDRAALGDIVFGDQDARQALNDITHPRIIQLLKKRIKDFRRDAGAGKAVLAVEIPLLIECGLEGLVDEVLLVAAEQRTQVSRLTTVGGLSAEQALQRIGAQMPLEEKLEKSDRVIRNDGDLESLEDSVRRAWGEISLL
jgi:dephospho-CoA kinase